MTSISKTSMELFLDLARDADNWSGCPLIGGNVEMTKELRGNLTQLKRAGLLTTQREQGEVWAIFTAAGKALALEHGIEIWD